MQSVEEESNFQEGVGEEEEMQDAIEGQERKEERGEGRGEQHHRHRYNPISKAQRRDHPNAPNHDFRIAKRRDIQ